jgi:putative transposase
MKNMLSLWVRRFAEDPQHAFPGQGQMKPEPLEIARLRREVIKHKAERDILKKAAAYCAKESTKFGFIAKHRGIWAVEWLCEALGVSRGGFYAWLKRSRSRSNEELGAKLRASFLTSDRTYGGGRIWKDLVAEGLSFGLHGSSG